MTVEQYRFDRARILAVLRLMRHAVLEGNAAAYLQKQAAILGQNKLLRLRRKFYTH